MTNRMIQKRHVGAAHSKNTLLLYGFMPARTLAVWIHAMRQLIVLWSTSQMERTIWDGEESTYTLNTSQKVDSAMFTSSCLT